MNKKLINHQFLSHCENLRQENFKADIKIGEVLKETRALLRGSKWVIWTSLFFIGFAFFFGFLGFLFFIPSLINFSEIVIENPAFSISTNVAISYDGTQLLNSLIMAVLVFSTLLFPLLMGFRLLGYKRGMGNQIEIKDLFSCYSIIISTVPIFFQAILTIFSIGFLQWYFSFLEYGHYFFLLFLVFFSFLFLTISVDVVFSFLVSPLVIHQKLPFIVALKLSFAVSSEIRTKLFVIYIIRFLILYSSFIFFFIPIFIWTVPFCLILPGVVYRKAFNLSIAGDTIAIEESQIKIQ